jgi:hypothetical protein
MATTQKTPLGPPQIKIELLRRVNNDPNNYVKAVVHHYDAGQEKGTPYHFFVQFNDRVQGAAELARRELESVVIPWIRARERNNRENHGRGYRPIVAFSILNRLEPHLHDCNLAVVGE